MKRSLITIGILALTAIVLVSVFASGINVTTSDGKIGISIGQAQAAELSDWTIKFEPSGTHIKDGYLKIRLDFYPSEGSLSYTKQHIYAPIIPPEGYSGKVDKNGNPIDFADYQHWEDSLPHEWKLNPAICLFVTVPPDISAAQITGWLAEKYKPDVIATLDNALIQPNAIHLVEPYLRDKTAITKQPVGTVNEQSLISEVNTRLSSFLLTSSGSGTAVKLTPQSIDMGASADNRTGSTAAAYTYVDLDNPANATGTITTGQSWWVTQSAGAVFGSMYLSSGTTYVCRDSEAVGVIAAGSLQTNTGLTISVTTGDYAGLYYTSGAVEYSGSGYLGVYYKSGQQIDPSDSANYTIEAGRAMSLYMTGTESGVSAPTVVTNATASVEETTATGSGNITATSENCTEEYFQYGTATGVYTDNVTLTESHGVGEVTFPLTGLTKGDEYFGRFGAKNSGGTSWGSEVTWITKPDPATSFHSTDNGTSWVFLEWTNGTGMDIVGIRYDTGSAPADNVTGTQGFWGNAASANITGLADNTTYHFRIDTYAFEGGLGSQADGAVTCQDKTDSLTVPTVTTNAASLVEETTARLNGEITDIGSGNVTAVTFRLGDSSGVYNTGNYTSSANDTTTTFLYDTTLLTKGEAYYYIASANNSAGEGSGSELKFLTKPDEPTNGSAVGGTGNITLTWTIGAGADNSYVYAKQGGYPTAVGDGTLIYSGTDNTTVHNGLGNNATWYYRVWSYATEDSMTQYSDTYTQMTDTTDIIAPVVTSSAATGVTDNDATLNGTITEDGGEACTVDWYWDTADRGETTAWANNSTQAGQVTGAISHAISDNLTPSTLYYWIIRVTNSVGDDWSASGNFTTQAPITTVYPPSVFTLTDFGAITVGVNWTLGLNAEWVYIRVSRTAFPATITNGEFFFSNNSSYSSCNGTGFALDTTTYYFSAWGIGADNVTYSTAYITASIGGDGMTVIATSLDSLANIIMKIGELGFSAFLVVGLLGLAIWKRDFVWFAASGLACLIIGLSWMKSYPGIAFAVIALATIQLLDAVVKAILPAEREKGISQFKGITNTIKGWF